MQSFSLKLRGLWVGLALGEWYVTQHRQGSVAQGLPHTEQWYQRTNHWLASVTADASQSFILNQAQSPDLSVAIIPLIFLHPLGYVKLEDTLKDCWANTNSIPILQAIATVQHFSHLLSPSKDFTQTTDIHGFETAQPSFPSHSTSDNRPKAEWQDPQWQDPQWQDPQWQDMGTTLHDFSLTVQRNTTVHQNQTLTLVSAALSGFHNGFRSLPLSWRHHLKHLTGAENQSWEEQLCHQADRVGAQWAGCCHGIPFQTLRGSTIAPMGQLRHR